VALPVSGGCGFSSAKPDESDLRFQKPCFLLPIPSSLLLLTHLFPSGGYFLFRWATPDNGGKEQEAGDGLHIRQKVAGEGPVLSHISRSGARVPVAQMSRWRPVSGNMTRAESR